MSWTDIKRRYEAEGGPASQSTEDMVARRILRALKITNSEKLYAAERETGAASALKEDATLLEQATELAMRMSDRFHRLLLVTDVSRFNDAETAVIEAYDNKNAARTAIAYRIKGTQDVRVLTCLGDPAVLSASDITTPCVLTRSKDKSLLLADCDAGDYFMKMLSTEV